MSNDTITAPRTLSKAAVCERLSISVRTLENLVRKNEFPPPVRMGRYVYWTEAAIAAWMQRLFGAQQQWQP